MLTKIIDKIREWNPQLFREIKGRWQSKNVVIVTLMAILGQMLLSYCANNNLPQFESESSRYCTYDSGYSYYNCLQDSHGNIIVNWQLWWLDMFIPITVMAIFLLLVVGVYLLIVDLAKEEKRGTLLFIRLSPQSATKILLGKILGVPILLYWMVILTLPLHLLSGLRAGIPLSLLISFYFVVGLSCFFFYSLALLYALVSNSLAGFQAWIGSFAVGCCVLSWTIANTTGYILPYQNILDWFRLLYPGTILPYLVAATSLPNRVVNYLPLDNITELSWYNLPLWNQAWLGISLVIINLGVCTFWIWQALKRRYHNINGTLFSKQQSYWFSTTTIAIVFGFALQTNHTPSLYNNFAGVLAFQLVLLLGLIVALTPSRQTLLDWSSYRHLQAKENRHIIKDLIWGEKSPAVLAIAINSMITGVVMLPGILLLLEEYTTKAILSLLFLASVVIIYAVVMQLILLLRNKRRTSWANGTIIGMSCLPMPILGILGLSPHKYAHLWLFVPFPTIAIAQAAATQIFFALIGQWLAISLGSFVLTKQLRKAGESQTKALLR